MAKMAHLVDPDWVDLTEIELYNIDTAGFSKSTAFIPPSSTSPSILPAHIFRAEMQSAIGILQLKKLKQNIKIRNKYAEMITNILRSYKSVIIQENPPEKPVSPPDDPSGKPGEEEHKKSNKGEEDLNGNE